MSLLPRDPLRSQPLVAVMFHLRLSAETEWTDFLNPSVKPASLFSIAIELEVFASLLSWASSTFLYSQRCERTWDSFTVWFGWANANETALLVFDLLLLSQNESVGLDWSLLQFPFDSPLFLWGIFRVLNFPIFCLVYGTNMKKRFCGTVFQSLIFYRTECWKKLRELGKYWKKYNWRCKKKSERIWW